MTGRVAGGGSRGSDPGAATRALATRAVARVLGDGFRLDEAFRSLDLKALADEDRAQVKALAFGALRWHHRHRRLLGILLDRPLAPGQILLEALLSVGLFQLLDPEQPDYAAVSATVEAARRLGRPGAVGLVNATLRRLQRERDALMAEALSTDDGRFSHPGWLIERLKRDWPRDWQSTLEAALRPPPLWLRVNAMRCNAAEYQARVAQAGLPAEIEPQLSHAVRLTRPLPAAEIPGFKQGEVTIQDAGSQLAAGLLAPASGARVLDACAAPGGKATHLLERAGGRLDLVALDIDARRLERLRENLRRLRLEATLIAADALQPSQWWDERPFDRILVDAPCSATGVIRRHPDIKSLRRASDIAPLAERQLALLDALWPLLRPGGRLLYSTCSILKQENVEVVTRFLGAHADAGLTCTCEGVVPDWARPQPEGGWQILPDAADTDGLYYALMGRSSSASTCQ